MDSTHFCYFVFSSLDWKAPQIMTLSSSAGHSRDDLDVN